MNLRDALQTHLEPAFTEVDPRPFLALGRHYRGKVRDLFIGPDEIWMVTTDRLSAFDVVLTGVPCKGAILNAIAVQAFHDTADICANHLISAPHPNILRVRRAEPLPIELIVRRHITGSLWRDIEAGRAGVYEVALPEGVRKDQRLDTPIITPSTKAEIGDHDAPISARAIVAQGLVDAERLEEAFGVALRLFQRGEEKAAERGLILVDTKYEMGIIDGELVVIDEIHTADSSRYWVAEEFAARFAAGESQKMLDKETIRQWLIGQGYQGTGTPPAIPDDIRLDLAETYATLHERLLGRAFEVPESRPESRPESTIADVLRTHL